MPLAPQGSETQRLTPSISAEADGLLCRPIVDPSRTVRACARLLRRRSAHAPPAGAHSLLVHHRLHHHLHHVHALLHHLHLRTGVCGLALLTHRTGAHSTHHGAALHHLVHRG